MRDFDRLPGPLRLWVASAVLPWRPHSVRRTYAKALARTGTPERALEELDRIQARLIARDTLRIWGKDHPGAPRTGPASG